MTCGDKCSGLFNLNGNIIFPVTVVLTKVLIFQHLVHGMLIKLTSTFSQAKRKWVYLVKDEVIYLAPYAERVIRLFKTTLFLRNEGYFQPCALQLTQVFSFFSFGKETRLIWQRGKEFSKSCWKTSFWSCFRSILIAKRLMNALLHEKKEMTINKNLIKTTHRVRFDSPEVLSVESNYFLLGTFCLDYRLSNGLNHYGKQKEGNSITGYNKQTPLGQSIKK